MHGWAGEAGARSATPRAIAALRSVLSVCYARSSMNASFREVAVDAATRAGALLRAHLGGTREVSYKGSPINLVTEMDRRSEALIVEAIRRHFPDHGILAEECGAIVGAGSHRWIVDPLDGTTNYAHGMPIYCVSIALEIGGRVALGVVYDPHRDECFVAARGRGATLNGAPLRVSTTATLGESLLSTGYQYDIRSSSRNNLAEHAALLLRSHSVREIGSAVLNLAYVAAGRLEAFWELSLGAWDVAAGALLVEEAGGRVTSPTGAPLDLAAPSIVASNGAIHDEILKVLAEVRAR
jgi:myo-inositol-1(or 4)-monophosphatase